PAHRGFRLAIPISLNRWMTCRTESSSACTSRAMTATLFPPAEASTHDHRPAQPHLRAGPSPGDPQQPLTFLVRQPPHTHRFCHHASLNDPHRPVRTLSGVLSSDTANVRGHGTDVKRPCQGGCWRGVVCPCCVPVW